MMGIKEDLLRWFISFFIVVLGSGVNIPLEFNKQLPKKMHKPIIRKL